MDPLIGGVVNFKQAELVSRIQFSVARKMLDNEQVQGAAAIKLIQAAGQSRQIAGDALAVAATGLGAQIDAYA